MTRTLSAASVVAAMALLLGPPMVVEAQQQGLPEVWSREHLSIMHLCRSEEDDGTYERLDLLHNLVGMLLADIEIDKYTPPTSSARALEANSKLSCFWRGVLGVSSQYEFLTVLLSDDGTKRFVMMAAPGRSPNTAWFLTAWAPDPDIQVSPGVWLATSLSLISANCGVGTLVTLSETHTFSDGSLETGDVDGRPQFVAPGSIGETRLGYACESSR